MYMTYSTYTMATACVKRARKAYDVTFKLKAVDFAEKESKEAAARQFGVDPNTNREWCQKKEQLVALKTSGKSKKKRLVRAGRKALDSDLEEALFSWIMELRSRNLPVSRCMIRVQARTMSSVSTFKASRGWLERFMKRYSLSLSVVRLRYVRIHQLTAFQRWSCHRTHATSCR